MHTGTNHENIEKSAFFLRFLCFLCFSLYGKMSLLERKGKEKDFSTNF